MTKVMPANNATEDPLGIHVQTCLLWSVVSCHVVCGYVVSGYVMLCYVRLSCVVVAFSHVML